MTAWIRICWAETGRGDVCAGTVSWSRGADGQWRSSCAKCFARGIAATGERVVLEQMEVLRGNEVDQSR